MHVEGDTERPREGEMHMHTPGSWSGLCREVPSRMKPTRMGHMEL